MHTSAVIFRSIGGLSGLNIAKQPVEQPLYSRHDTNHNEIHKQAQPQSQPSNRSRECDITHGRWRVWCKRPPRTFLVRSCTLYDTIRFFFLHCLSIAASILPFMVGMSPVSNVYQ